MTHRRERTGDYVACSFFLVRRSELTTVCPLLLGNVNARLQMCCVVTVSRFRKCGAATLQAVDGDGERILAAFFCPTGRASPPTSKTPTCLAEHTPTGRV